MHLTSLISLDIKVTHFTWITHNIDCSYKFTKYISVASCKAMIACDWNLRSVLKSCATSLINHWNGSLGTKNFIELWCCLISLRAHKLCLFWFNHLSSLALSNSALVFCLVCTIAFVINFFVFVVLRELPQVHGLSISFSIFLPLCFSLHSCLHHLSLWHTEISFCFLPFNLCF